MNDDAKFIPPIGFLLAMVLFFCYQPKEKNNNPVVHVHMVWKHLDDREVIVADKDETLYHLRGLPQTTMDSITTATKMDIQWDNHSHYLLINYTQPALTSP